MRTLRAIMSFLKLIGFGWIILSMQKLTRLKARNKEQENYIGTRKKLDDVDEFGTADDASDWLRQRRTRNKRD